MRRLAPVFILACAALSASCYIRPMEDFPIEINIDSDFTPGEREAIIGGFERWEEAAGIDFFYFSPEPYADEFTREDLFDGVHVVYKVHTDSEVGVIDEGTDGYGPHSDVLILWYVFAAPYNHCNFDDCGADTEDMVTYLLEVMITHEVGHFLGLGHDYIRNCGEAMMNGHVCIGDYPGEWEIPQSDVDSLCEFYPCER